MFPLHVIQWNIFLVLNLGIWWHQEIWKCKIPRFDLLQNKKSFWIEIKNFFPQKQTNKNVADTTFKAVNSNLLNVFLFTELDKNLGFLLGVRYNSKITVLKLKVLLSDMVAIVVTCVLWEKVNVMYSGLKMLETIITEVTFTEFSVWIFCHEQLWFTGQQGKGEAISLIPRNHFHRFTDT